MEARPNPSTSAPDEAQQTRSPRAPARKVGAALGTAAAMYVAFAVGAPWLLRDAPPDSYAVVASKATCAHDAQRAPCCDPRWR